MQLLRRDLRILFGILVLVVLIMFVAWQSNKTDEIREILSNYIAQKQAYPTADVNSNLINAVPETPPNVLQPEDNLKFGPPGNSPPEEEFERLWNYVYKLQYNCSNVETLGGRSYGDGDGSYPVCLEPKFWKGKTADGYQCLLYSFGVGGDFSFDDAMAKKGCEVHSFDPTTNLDDGFKRESGVVFHKIGISSKDNDKDAHGWKMRTLRTLLKELGHKGRYLDFLKIDTDSPDGGGFEHETMQELLDTGLYKCVRQFGLEIHLPGPIVNPKWLERCRLFYRQLSQLYERKYRLYAITDNVRAERILRKNPNFSQIEKKGNMVKGGGTILWEVAFVNFDPQPCQL